MRRETLDRNLRILLSRIEDGITPLHIIEGWVFGSFLRPKKDPNDIDMVLFYKKDPEFDEKVEKFLGFIKYMRESAEKEGNYKRLENLSKADPRVMELLREHFPGLPVDVWVQYIETKGYFKEFLKYSFNPIEVTKRILKKSIRGIQITDIYPIENRDSRLARMTAQSFKLVWSEYSRDINKNLTQSKYEQTNLTLDEIKNFAIQIERHKSYYDVLISLLKWAIESIQVKGILKTPEQIAERLQLVGGERGILGSYLQWIEYDLLGGENVDEPSLNDHVTIMDINARMNQIKSSVKNLEDLGDLCESNRGEINDYHDRCAVAKTLLHYLFRLPYNYIPPIEERVSKAVSRTLENVPMYRASDMVKRRVLSDIGLDKISENIILVENLGSKSQYYNTHSDEERARLIDQSKIGKMEKEHAKYLRPILRKAFEKTMDTYLFLTSKVNAQGVAVIHYIYLTASTYEPEIESFVDLANSMGFEIDTSDSAAHMTVFQTPYVRAELKIDVRHLNGDKNKIKALVKEKLSIQAVSR